MPRAHTPQQEKPPQWETYAPQLENSFCFLQLEIENSVQSKIK